MYIMLKTRWYKLLIAYICKERYANTLNYSKHKKHLNHTAHL